MDALRVVIRVGILWVLSLGAAWGGMEAGHQIVLAIDHDRAPHNRAPAPASSVADPVATRE